MRHSYFDWIFTYVCVSIKRDEQEIDIFFFKDFFKSWRPSPWYNGNYLKTLLGVLWSAGHLQGVREEVFICCSKRGAWQGSWVMNANTKTCGEDFSGCVHCLPPSYTFSNRPWFPHGNSPIARSYSTWSGWVDILPLAARVKNVTWIVAGRGGWAVTWVGQGPGGNHPWEPPCGDSLLCPHPTTP